MARDRILDGLITYYAVWQVGHMVFNVIAAATGTDSARAVLGDGFTDVQWQAVWISGYIDFFFASPLGIAFAVGWRKDRPWALPLGAASLTAALASAGFVYWLQWTFTGALQLGGLGLAGLITFIPVLVLAVLLPVRLRAEYRAVR